MKLHQLLEEIKDEKLNKEQLEDYFSHCCQLRGQVKMEIGTYKKKKAIFLSQRPDGVSVASRKIDFDASPEGQRLQDLISYASALNDAKDGLKSRIYAKLS